MAAGTQQASKEHGTVRPRGVSVWRPFGRAARAYLPAAAVLAAVVIFWQLWVDWRDVRPSLFPSPADVWDAFLRTRSSLPGHVRVTVLEALYGLGLAAAVAAALSALLASNALARRAVFPLLVVSQNIPLIVLAPLMIIWFGFGIAPKVALVALVGFFPIVVSTTDALLHADRDLVDMVRSMGAGRLQVLRHVLIPSAMPAFFAGLKIAATYAVLAAVFAEWMGAQQGLGLYISRSSSSFRTDQVFVGVVIVALTSIALFVAVNLAARLATPWMYVSEKSQED